MTRNDLALLVFKTLALWLGTNGLVALVGLPLAIQTLRFQRELWAVTSVALLPAAGGVLLWVSSPRLARSVFRQSSQEIPVALTSEDIPSLASFVVGLLLFVEAVPQSASWLGVLVIRVRVHSSVLGSTLPWGQALDEQALATGVGLLLRIVVGVALIAGSRRFSGWTTKPTTADAEGDG